jgi:hypothetical protein
MAEIFIFVQNFCIEKDKLTDFKQNMFENIPHLLF